LTYAQLSVPVTSAPSDDDLRQLREGYVQKMIESMHLTQDDDEKIKALENRVSVSYDARFKTVNVRINNDTTTNIPFSDVMESESYKKAREKGKLVIPIGPNESSSENNQYVDLAVINHLIVCGATGQGKGGTARAIAAALSSAYGPDEVRMGYIDPKGTRDETTGELSSADYKDMENDPHTIHIATAEDANAFMKWMDKEDKNRIAKIGAANCQNLVQYNELMKGKKNPDGTPATIPHLVMIVDEFSNLLKQSGRNETSNNLESLMERARASGIHLVLMTQTPDAKTLTTQIRGQAGGLICHKVEEAAAAVQALRPLKGCVDQTGQGSYIYDGDYLDKEGNTVKKSITRGQMLNVGRDGLKKIADYNSGHNGGSSSPSPDSNGGGGGGGDGSTKATSGGGTASSGNVTTAQGGADGGGKGGSQAGNTASTTTNAGNTSGNQPASKYAVDAGQAGGHRAALQYSV